MSAHPESSFIIEEKILIAREGVEYSLHAARVCHRKVDLPSEGPRLGYVRSDLHEVV